MARFISRLASAALLIAASGCVSAQQLEGTGGDPDYATVLSGFDRAVSENLYDPRLLETPGYQAFRQEFGLRVGQAENDQEVLTAFRASWKEGLFSHFDLRAAGVRAVETTAALQAAGANRENAVLTYPADDVALLTITTFLGDTVISQILEALAEVRTRQVKSLIIDLRENDGGSLAGTVLVQSLLEHPETIGAFVNRLWWGRNDHGPDATQIAAITPLAQLDPGSFAADLADDGISVVRLPPISGPPAQRVFLLTSRRTASMAELAAAAIKGAEAAVLIGETTAGEMLSGEFADAAPGFQVFMPMADYYSRSEGRIEGVGVQPHVLVDADQALATALEMAREP